MRIERHTAGGWWLEEAGAPTPRPALNEDLSADVVVIGGGFTGMWAAWDLLEQGATVALLEGGLCGHGPSGRNGGFCETLWSNLPSLRERFDDERALAACRASSESVRAIGAWCEAEGVDAWFRPNGFVMASTTEAQDAVIERILTAAPAARMRSSRRSCPSAVEAMTKPDGRNQASTACASHQAPIASTLSEDAWAAASARSAPKPAISSGRLLHSVSQKPPLRPLGPCPHKSASSSATRAPRSRSCHAVQSPT